MVRHIPIAMVLLGFTSAATLVAASDTQSDTKTSAGNCTVETSLKAALEAERQAQSERLNDAMNFARDWILGKMAICGDWSFREYHTQIEHRSWDTLTEFKDFKFWIEPDILTEADLLNRVAFKGRLHISANGLRQYDSYHGQWTPRSVAQPGAKCCLFNVALPITNQQGRWTVDTAQNPFWWEPNKTTCNAAAKTAAEQ